MNILESVGATKVADEVFIATALLHRENPNRRDFSVSEIVARAKKEGLHPDLRPGVQVHAYLHCVANKEANSVTCRMLYDTGDSRRRLLRVGDEVHPSRKGKIFPKLDEVPGKYWELINWAKARYQEGADSATPAGELPSRPTGLRRLFALRGMGAKFWKAGEADAYVDSLRKDWE